MENAKLSNSLHKNVAVLHDHQLFCGLNPMFMLPGVLREFGGELECTPLKSFFDRDSLTLHLQNPVREWIVVTWAVGTMSWALPQDNAMLLHWLVFIPAEHIYLSQEKPSGLLNIMMKLKLNANTKKKYRKSQLQLDRRLWAGDAAGRAFRSQIRNQLHPSPMHATHPLHGSACRDRIRRKLQ